MIGPGPGLILFTMLEAAAPRVATGPVSLAWTTTAYETPVMLICYSDECHGEARVKVLKDGRVVFGAGYDPDETARAFWKSIGEMRDRYESERWYR